MFGAEEMMIPRIELSIIFHFIDHLMVQRETPLLAGREEAQVVHNLVVRREAQCPVAAVEDPVRDLHAVDVVRREENLGCFLSSVRTEGEGASFFRQPTYLILLPSKIGKNANNF